MEGAPTVTATNSQWSFKSNGTYEWFLNLAPFDLSATGNYSLSGTTLNCDGDITMVTGTSNIALTFSNNNNTFSYVDDEGDRWTYNRM